MRKLARELEMPFNAEDPANLEKLCQILGAPREASKRLAADLQGGIPHEVLNARKHTEESQIIAGAGAFGAVTIATNMAGRGVDIKLGGELAEEILASVHRVLARNGYNDPYNMTMSERRQALLKLKPEEMGIYDSEVNFFLQHMEEMDQVRRLGGLHVIGSERHDARRIDNQLRGRSARQGDPGASRFFLSMEDQLMRLFGGQQADAMMQRLKIDDALPLEVGLVSRLVEQAQTRVEGANFDMRKHLLEYDDVLNAQRAAIYGQRNRIFTKDDLKDDVTEMLRTEVARRIPEALKDEGGPWKLLAWLEQIQPALSVDGKYFPSYALRLLLQNLRNRLPQNPSPQEIKNALLQVAADALQAEKQHHLKSIQSLLENSRERLEEQLTERLEIVDTYFSGLETPEEDDQPARKPNDMVNELAALARVPLRLSPEAVRSLRQEPGKAAAEARQQVENAVYSQAIARVTGAVERRIEEPLELSTAQLPLDDWQAMGRQLLQRTESLLQARQERFLGENGQITRELDTALTRLPDPGSEQSLLRLLLLMPQGARTTFDRKTHRKKLEQTNRLAYVYLMARLLDNQEPDEIAADVLEHLEEAQEAVGRAWGQAELARLGQYKPVDLGENFRQALLENHGDQASAWLDNPMQTLEGEARQAVGLELGRRSLSAIYRQLLLGVISELWVEYLTQMEALRISIGLEAYAQRDPLVQYKSKAFELFQELLANMRLGVVTRMFTYRPRDLSSVQAASQGGDGAAALESGGGMGDEEDGSEDEGGDANGADVKNSGGLAAGGGQGSANRQTNPSDGNKKRKRRR